MSASPSEKRSISGMSGCCCSYLLILLIIGLMAAPSNCYVASPLASYSDNTANLGPAPDLYLRFRKNAPNNRQHRSDEYIHPFIRFRKSSNPYEFLYPSFVPTDQ